MTIDEIKALYGLSDGRKRRKYKCEESDIQQACVRWFRYTFPKYIISAVPNGGSRNVIEAAKMRKEGVLAGFADLIIIADHKILFVEMKSPKGKQQETQKAFQKKVEILGFRYVVCKSFDEFKMVVNTWLGHNKR